MNWQTLKERYLTAIIVCLGLVGIIATMMFFSHKIALINAATQNELKKYQKVVQLYQQIRQCEAQKAYFKGSLLLLSRPLKAKGVGDKILSIRPDAEEGIEAVHIKFQGLSLPELLDIFKLIAQYDNLEVRQFLLKKTFTKPDLLDLDIDIGKTR